jgi:cytochrome P450
MGALTGLAPRFLGEGFLGNVRGMRERPLEFLAQVHETCGPIARFRLGPYEAHLVTEPDAIKQVLVEKEANYDRHTRQFDVMGLALGQGLLTSSGAFWKRQRRIAQPAFHRRRVASLAVQVSQAANEMMAKWSDFGRQGTVFDLSHAMREVTLQVIVRTMFAARLQVDTQEIASAIEEMTAYVDRAMTAAVGLPLAIPTLANVRFKRARRAIDSITRQLVTQRRESAAQADDLLSFLTDARDEETGEGLTDRQICDEVKTMLLAGHETSANSLTWTFYLLGKAPDVMRRVVAEAREVLGDRVATFEDCSRLPLISKVIQESLRLYPPGWLIGRNVAREDRIGGFRIRPGSMMFVAPYVTHRLPEYWPNPLAFDPERFSPERTAQRPRHAYLPFGAGPHLCIGQAFAMLEMQLIVATVAQHFTVIPEPVHAVVPNPRVTLSLKHGLPVRVRSHEAPLRLLALGHA